MKVMLLYFYTLRMEAADSLETLVNMDHTARCHVQNDSNYHSNRCEVKYDYVTISPHQKQEDNRRLSKYREDFYFVDRFHGSALHGDRGAACREAPMNFADESARMMADNVRNEVVTIHRQQTVLKMFFLYT
jgi:hypothetical protein